MLKHSTLRLRGKDAGLEIQLTELPALVADRAARAALRAIDEEQDGGIVALALQHSAVVRKVDTNLLWSFVQAAWRDTAAQRWQELDPRRHLRDWRNIELLQNAALHLHVGFLLDRKPLDVPVAFQAAQLTSGISDCRATWCSPHIAAVLSAKMATYRELETVLSVEDTYNLVEILNVDALREYSLKSQKSK